MILTWESRYLLVLFCNTSWNIFSLSFATFLMRMFPQLGNCTSSINFFCSSKVRATNSQWNLTLFSWYLLPTHLPAHVHFLYPGMFTPSYMFHWVVIKSLRCDANGYQSLTHFQPMLQFYTPWRHPKTSVFYVIRGI